MGQVHPGKRIHLEMRARSFVLYLDGGKERIELPYGDIDEVLEQLTKAMASPQYLEAEQLPARLTPDGHMLDDSPKLLRKSSNGRKRMRPICHGCGQPVNDPDMVDLAQREMDCILCTSCYLKVRGRLYPSQTEGQRKSMRRK